MRWTIWFIVLMHDVVDCSRRLRMFNVVDDLNRKALSIEFDLNLPTERVVRLLDRIAANRGFPAIICRNNVPVIIPLALAQ